MNKIWNAIKRHPKKAILAGSLAIIGLLPIVSNAWGPERTTFKIDKPTDYVVFNSITNNPAHGDERNFVRIKEAGAGTYSDKIAVTPGKKYTVMVYYHNNAAANLNLVATNTRMNTQLPTAIEAGKQAMISAKIKADNAKPNTVWDEVYVTSAQNVALKYVSNSATIHSKGAVNGKKLNSTEFLTSGALIGYNALDGKVPGCHQFAGYVTYDFIVETTDKPNFTIAKTVSKSGEMKFGENVNTADNQVVDFKIIYTNTGNTTQTNVIVRDVLPAGMTYVKGSAKYSSAATGNKPIALSDNLVSEKGVNINNYGPGANAFILFSAKVNDMDCGKNEVLTNTAYAITKDGTKSDTAKVTVKTEACPVPTVKQIEVCDLTNNQIVKINEDKFDGKKHSKNLSDCDKKEAPQETPKELPTTGPVETLSQVIGLGSLVTSAGYYITSRRMLSK